MRENNRDLALGIDLGTTNYKACLYDRTGTLLGIGNIPTRYTTDNTGRVELPVDQFFSLLRQAIDAAAAQAGRSLDAVAAVAYSSQANTFLLLNEAMQPLTPFIVWTDHRSKAFPPAYQALAETPEFLRRVGFDGIAPGMMVSNMEWFRQHQPETIAATRHILTLPDFLVYQLTGLRAGDNGSGALLGLWDLTENRWWPEAAAAARLDIAHLPEFLYPGTTAGRINPHGHEAFGLPEGIPVVVGSLDHHVAAIGAGAGKKAPFSISMGTVLAVTCLDNRYVAQSGCCVGPGMNGEGYYRLAWHNHGTRALNWYQEHFAPDISVKELLTLAAAVPPDTVLPAVKLCPWEDREAAPAAAFSDGHASADAGVYVLAILQSLTDLLKDMLHRLQPDLVRHGMVVTGGGAKCDLWMRMIADQIQAPVYRAESEQAGCLGAAVLAAVGAGWYPDIDSASAAMVGISETITPGNLNLEKPT